MRQIHPIMLRDTLIKLGYSNQSAQIIASQYIENPFNRNKWGTEEQTRKDVEYAIKIHGTNK